jgi:hypothetical protein
LKIRKIPKKYPEIIFSQKTQEARRRSWDEPRGTHTPGWRDLTPGRASPIWGRPGPLLISPLRVLHHPQKPKSGGAQS